MGLVFPSFLLRTSKEEICRVAGIANAGREEQGRYGCFLGFRIYLGV